MMYPTVTSWRPNTSDAVVRVQKKKQDDLFVKNFKDGFPGKQVRQTDNIIPAAGRNQRYPAAKGGKAICQGEPRDGKVTNT